MKLAPLFENFILLRYLLSGTIASLVQISSLFIFVQAIRAPQTVLSCAAFTLAVFVNYSLQRAFTFNSRAPHSVVFPKFVAVAICGFFLNAVIFYAFSHYMNYLVAQVFTIFVVLIFNFLMNKKFVFSYRH
jgi:putative flippase GtrA